jgi:hypothetical protein
MQTIIAWAAVAVFASWITVLVKRKRRLARVIVSLHLQGKSREDVIAALEEKRVILNETIREKEEKRWQVGIASCSDCDSLARVKFLHEQVEHYDLELAALRILRNEIEWAMTKLSH